MRESGRWRFVLKLKEDEENEGSMKTQLRQEKTEGPSEQNQNRAEEALYTGWESFHSQEVIGLPEYNLWFSLCSPNDLIMLILHVTVGGIVWIQIENG